MAGKYNPCLVSYVEMWFDTLKLAVILTYKHWRLFLFFVTMVLNGYATPAYHKINIPEKQDLSMIMAGRSLHN